VPSQRPEFCTTIGNTLLTPVPVGPVAKGFFLFFVLDSDLKQISDIFYPYQMLLDKSVEFSVGDT
jgi:hypothetical protein